MKSDLPRNAERRIKKLRENLYEWLMEMKLECVEELMKTNTRLVV